MGELAPTGVCPFSVEEVRRCQWMRTQVSIVTSCFPSFLHLSTERSERLASLWRQDMLE